MVWHTSANLNRSPAGSTKRATHGRALAGPFCLISVRYGFSVHENAELISKFYSAFQEGDHATMASCYSDGARFSDPVFPDLNAEEARAMWRMFCTSGNEIDVTFSEVSADDSSGSAHWEARYRFPKTGRPVHNKIDAFFEFSDGLITRHRDDFDFYRWSRMALGPVGTLLGWSPIVKNQIRSQAASQLRRFNDATPDPP